MGGAIGLKRVCWRSGVGMHLGGASCKRRWRAVVRGHGRQATGTQRGTKEKKLCIAAAGDVALIRGCQQRQDQDFCSPSKLGGREERRLGGGWRTAGRGPGSEAARALSGCCGERDTARPLTTSVARPPHHRIPSLLFPGDAGAASHGPIALRRLRPGDGRQHSTRFLDAGSWRRIAQRPRVTFLSPLLKLGGSRRGALAWAAARRRIRLAKCAITTTIKGDGAQRAVI